MRLYTIEREWCCEDSKKLCCFHVTALGFILFGRKDGNWYFGIKHWWAWWINILQTSMFAVVMLVGLDYFFIPDVGLIVMILMVQVVTWYLMVKYLLKL